MNDIFCKANRWLVLPMPVEVPDWTLVPKDNGRLVTEAEKRELERRFEWQGLEAGA